MARLIWTEPALADLDEVAEYIALDNEGAARKLVQTVFLKVERLQVHPESGRRPPELGKSTVREVVVGPLRIFYRFDGESVFILHVMRGERDLRIFLIENLPE